MIGIRIHLLANQGKHNELRQAVEDLSRRIAMESGCLGCWVFQNTGNDCELVLIEEWQNLESIQAHASSSNMAILAGAGTVLAERIRVYPEQEPKIQTIKTMYQKRFSPKLHKV